MTGAKIVARRAKSRGHVVGRAVAVLIVLVWSGVCAAEVLNPGFELTKNVSGRVLPQSWIPADHLSFNSYCTNLWRTEGQLSVGMFSKIGRGVSPGNGQGFYQFVDLTGIASIEFDVRLSARPQGLFEHFEASFLVDGAVLWSSRTDGTYTDQKVDVSKLAGLRRIEIRNAAVDAGIYGAAYWTEWDNVRLIEKPKTIPAVIDLEPDVLHLHSFGQWMVCYIELPAGYDVNDIDETTVTLQDIPACLGQEDRGMAALHRCKVTDHDRDGIPELRVRFDEGAVRRIVQPPEATLTLKGTLKNKTPIEGSATIKVVDRLAELKARLERLRAEARDRRDKCKDDKKRDAEIKDIQDQIRDAMDKCKDKDDRGARKR